MDVTDLGSLPLSTRQNGTSPWAPRKAGVR